MRTCPKCGEKIYISTFTIEECPVCGSKLDSPSQQKESIEKTYLKNLKRENKSELNDELTSSYDTQKKGSSELNHFKKNRPKPQLYHPSLEWKNKPHREINMGDMKDSVKNQIGGFRKTFEKTAPITGMDLKKIDEVVNSTLLNHINIDISKIKWPETYFCETLEDYLDEITKELEISDTIRNDFISYYKEREEKAKKEERHYSRTLGMNIPGCGFYINGHYFSIVYGCDSLESICKNNEAYTELLLTIAHEKLGHGFIDLFTAHGEDLRKIKITNRLLSELFYYKAVDTPEGELSQEKWDILFESTKFTQEGYSSWIEEYALFEMKKMGEIEYIPFKRTDINTIISILNKPPKFETTEALIEDQTILYNISDGLENLFNKDVNYDNNEDAEKGNLVIYETIRLLQEYGHTIDELVQIEGRPWQGHAYDIGYFLIKKIEKKFSIFCVPLAVQIACNVKYGIDSISNTDLYRMVYEKPRLNINTRLAQLSCLPEPEEIPTNNVKYFSELARELLNFTPP